MAINTEARRRSAIATRRLPWFRRFIPLPDGTISQGDKQSLAFVYSGIDADIVPQPPFLSRTARVCRTIDLDAAITRTADVTAQITRTIERDTERR